METCFLFFPIIFGVVSLSISLFVIPTIVSGILRSKLIGYTIIGINIIAFILSLIKFIDLNKVLEVV